MKVVLPFYSGDARLLDKNLMWYKELDGKLDYDCYLAADDTVQNMDGYVALAGTIFRTVQTIRYKRARHNHWPFQQNNAFMNVAHVMARQREPWLWMETDATPVKRQWVQALEAEYIKGKKPFGGHWNHQTSVFNGVAIYPPNISRYAPKMLLAALISSRNPDGRPYQPPWDAHGSKEVFGHLHIMNSVMQHIWDVNSTCPTFPDSDSVVKLVRPEVFIFHRCKDGTLIDRLKDPGRIGSKARCLVGLESVHVTVPEPPKKIKQGAKLKTSLFVVSFRGDFDWLPFLFRSIEKYCHGFHEVVLAVPTGDAALLGLMPTNVKVVEFPEDGFMSGFMCHQWIKLNADKYCSGDVIVHVDSDSVFIAPTTPQTFLTSDNKCINLCERFENAGDAQVWQASTEMTVGRKVEFETMRRLGLCYPRECYKGLRDHFEKVNRRPLREYLEAIPARGTAKETFSEFNAIGAFGMYFMADRFKFIDVGKEKKPENTIHQFWSIDRPTQEDVQAKLKEFGLI